VIANDTPNFAPKGNIVAGVRRGTGIMVMANLQVVVSKNQIDGNPTTAVMVVSYPNAFTDVRYNPTPRRVFIIENIYGRNGNDPQLDGAKQLLAAFGGVLPSVLWDGLGEAPKAIGRDDAMAWSLNLPSQGAGFDKARPAPLRLDMPLPTTPPGAEQTVVGAPAGLDLRARP
jgi:hypothetical protein